MCVHHLLIDTNRIRTGRNGRKQDRSQFANRSSDLCRRNRNATKLDCLSPSESIQGLDTDVEVRRRRVDGEDVDRVGNAL